MVAICDHLFVWFDVVNLKIWQFKISENCIGKPSNCAKIEKNFSYNILEFSQIKKFLIFFDFPGNEIAF